MKIFGSDIHRYVAGKKGFTLVELLIIICITAILMAASIPSFIEWRRNANVRKTANDITSFLRVAQSSAISNGLQQQVVFNPASNCYQLQSYDLTTSGFNPPTQTICTSADVSITSSLDGTSTDTLTVRFKTNGTAAITGPDGALRGNVSVNEGGTQKYLVYIMQTGKVTSQKIH